MGGDGYDRNIVSFNQLPPISSHDKQLFIRSISKELDSSEYAYGRYLYFFAPPPQLAYNVCPFGRGGGLYPTNGEARSHFYIPGISRGREETDDSEKMYINYGSFRKISWDIWKKLLNTWKGKCFLMYKRCFCFILKIRFWHDEHLQHAKNISKKTTCLSNKRRIFLF